MIAIIDYGMGNVSSIKNMINKVGGESIITMDPNIIDNSQAIILPGVGSFDNGITKLISTGLLSIIEKKVLINKIPFLGICLGMQLLFEKSEEGISQGLGWVPGGIKKFSFHNINHHKPRIPHMGWNSVSPTNFDCIFNEIGANSRFYFVHSYYAVPNDPTYILANTEYGNNFVCAVRKENIWGVQFHPEKSHRFGLTLFDNFLKIINC